jgi:hypothetical protein
MNKSSSLFVTKPYPDTLNNIIDGSNVNVNFNASGGGSYLNNINNMGMSAQEKKKSVLDSSCSLSDSLCKNIF